MPLKDNATILFFGDSITDVGRDRDNPAHLGHGFVSTAAARLMTHCAERRYTFYNRGVSGNQCRDLEARLADDCLALKPDLVSLLVGINDAIGGVWNKPVVTPHEFETHYRAILDPLRKRGSALIIGEPFLLPVPTDYKKIRANLDPFIDICRNLAREYRAHYVPFDGCFAAATLRRAPQYWCGDGIHPSVAGQDLMAHFWLETTASLWG